MVQAPLAQVDGARATHSFPQLSEAEARQRLASEGPNTLESEAPRTLLRAALQVLRQPMFLLLLAAGALYLALGNPADALTLLVFVFVVMGLTLYQDRRSERAVRRLQDLTAPSARVLREGNEQVIPSADVVRGDLVLLAEGDRVPADAVVLQSTNLRVDESLLTGESAPVDKLPGAVDDALLAPGNASSTAVYGSTLVVRGRGIASVKATGARSAVGAIGSALNRTEPPKSALTTEVDRLVLRIAWLGAGVCALLVLAQGLSTGDYLGGLLQGITLAMAILPEEFPVVLTVFTTLGAFRIAKYGVLARRPEAIESLGSARVLCVDKTGTITENHMRVAALAATDAPTLDLPRELPSELPERVHELVEFALLACPEGSSDPMERALEELAQQTLRGTEHMHHDYKREQEYPLTRELLAVSHLFQTPQAKHHVAAAKGAPEAIFDLCHLSEQRTTELLGEVEALAARGLRVLAVARASFDQEQHPPHQHDFAFALVGLLGFEDPVRASVPDAVRSFQRAGVRVVMITGDHATTARAIAQQAGLDLSHGVLTGQELAALSREAQAKAVAEVNVFARATPEHKLMLVQAFAARGEIVAMTGDGVNDAPALRGAHIGIALGKNGTDVAREAAALVLTNEDFGAIAQAIVLGRRIFENLRRAMTYVIAVHVPIAGMALCPVLLGLPSLLFPVHILFLELIIDPACTVALEAEEPDPRLLLTPPRTNEQTLFGRRSLLLSVLQGSVLFLGVLALYAFSLRHATAPDEARARAFIALVVGNVALITVQRSSLHSALYVVLHSRNKLANALSLFALSALALTLSLPALRERFHFAVPSLQGVLLAVLVGLASVLWYDLVKRRGGS